MRILAECYGDTLLIKQLKYEFSAYHSGIGEVANQMRKHSPNTRAIAIIDDDKNPPSYFNSECEQVAKKNGVILLKHKKADHYVIKITPALEDFINSAASGCKLDLFEKDDKRFREIVKDRKLHSNEKFVNYLNRLIQKKPVQIQTLKEFIERAKNAPKPLIVKSEKKKKARRK